MSRPTVSICVHCDDGAAGDGEALYERVRKLRKRLGLKPVFRVEPARCLGLCGAGCNVVFEGKKRSTYTRTQVHAEREVDVLVEAACAYAALEPGAELSERQLPGLAAD
jgi:predicted metal-binding protein